MYHLQFLLAFLLSSSVIVGQQNITISNPDANAVLLGNYNPDDYEDSDLITDHKDMIAFMHDNVSADNLHNLIVQLTSFETRNTGSDTMSMTEGIGAARRWIHQYFSDLSLQNNDRVLPFYVAFDQDICGMDHHKNVGAILPGSRIDPNEVIIIEAHMDSRCESSCDTSCSAHGAEDNASGTALVMELARLMAGFDLKSTVVFLCTTGEEQGLLGAHAFAAYCDVNDINVKAVFNNDIVGGIVCGETASGPPCPFEGHIDSTQVRLFAQSGRSRQLARFNRLVYQRELQNNVSVPMTLTIMSQEDRTGRGGDHIPFRQRGYAAMRFTSANENGSANTSDPDYDDHQHTSEDVLGVDTDGDMVIDSFFVNFNYLARNLVINGNSIVMASEAPPTPDFDVEESETKLVVTIDDPHNFDDYLVLSRTSEETADTIYHLEGSNTIEINRSTDLNYLQKVSVAAIDGQQRLSLLSREDAFFPTTSSTDELYIDGVSANKLFQLKSAAPNPYIDYTDIEYRILQAHLIEAISFEVYSESGNITNSFKLTDSPGVHTLRISEDELPSGFYVGVFYINNQIAGRIKLMRL